jgi:hypothetical protein
MKKKIRYCIILICGFIVMVTAKNLAFSTFGVFLFGFAILQIRDLNNK